MSGGLPRVRVSGLSVRYGKRTAVDGVSFDVAPGEIFGLLGPNGSGKTSLFRVLSTERPASGGEVWIAGASLAADPDAARRELGVVFQFPALDRKLTARENLAVQGRLYGLSGGLLRERVGEALARASLASRAGDLVGTFSGGMRRRLDLARGLMHRPSVLLLDEPTESLDPGARRDFWDALLALREERGLTVVLTTHAMDEAERCGRVGILCDGRLAALGTPSQLKGTIRGDVVVAETGEPEALARDVAAAFGGAVQAVSGGVRIERDNGPAFVARLAEAFPGRIAAIRVGQPTLEDVFAHVTGREFREEGA